MHASLIYPHQLHPLTDHPALATGRTVYLVEEPLLLTEFPTHAAKLILHRESLQTYATLLTGHNYPVVYLDVRDHPTTTDIFNRIARDGVTHLHVIDTTDNWLERRLTEAATKHNFTLVRYESPLFLLSASEAQKRYISSKRHMANFYRSLRQDWNILMTDDGPLGGQFSFDPENRKRLPRKHPLPTDIPMVVARTDTQRWLLELPQKNIIGQPNAWVPSSHTAATLALNDFLTHRLSTFGPYEDAISTESVRVFHSALSPLINIGLLSPQQVLEAVLARASNEAVPLPSVEGFVRQLIGWREFIRAAYLVDGPAMRQGNFFSQQRELPSGSWDGTTKITPLDHTITTALQYGYTHHIERLMVAGNIFLLAETHPDHVYRWFMALYVDAYDWVMVPNVYGMSQFADGGLFATKPYISGASYLKKMSDHASGPWEDIVTGLYWRFIGKHRSVFSKNYRLSMMPKLLDRLPTARREHLLASATTWLETTPTK